MRRKIMFEDWRKKVKNYQGNVLLMEIVKAIG